jgi:hypothetical protein
VLILKDKRSENLTPFFSQTTPQKATPIREATEEKILF